MKNESFIDLLQSQAQESSSCFIFLKAGNQIGKTTFVAIITINVATVEVIIWHRAQIHFAVALMNPNYS